MKKQANKSQKEKYKLYLASGITLWKEYFSKEYSKFFNKKVALFEPGILDNPDDHRKIPIGIACYDLNEINHSDALLVYMKKYKTLDGSPTGTDSTWECGYAIGHGKPVIMLIEDFNHMDYYASQWMVTFSINAILTKDKKVAEIATNHPKFVHTTILFAQGSEEFESKIIEYLDNYYRSIYSRSGIVNYYVDDRARDMFCRENFRKIISAKNSEDHVLANYFKILENLEFKNDDDYLKVCEFEKQISGYLKGNLTEEKVNSTINSVVANWGVAQDVILDCLEHSIKAPFVKIEDRKQGIKKTRPELFFELYDLVTHHLINEQRFIKSESFPYEIGAIIELYNWMNTYSLDDVFDNSKYRQKIKTVWFEFSRRDAVFTGVLGHLMCLKYLFVITKDKPSLGIELGNIMNNYNLIMYEGQEIDLLLTFDSDKKKEILKTKNFEELSSLYIQRIYKICGGFYEAIGLLSAKAGNKEEQIMNGKEIDTVSPLVGMFYGIIQMIRNDLGDYLVVENMSGMSKGMKDISHSDIREGKVDLCYLVTLNSPHVSKEEKDYLIDCLHKELNEDDKLKINELLWRTGSVEFAVDLIINIIKYVKYSSSVYHLLSSYQETPTRMRWMFNLIDITKEILIPFKQQALNNEWFKYEYDSVLLENITAKILSLNRN